MKNAEATIKKLFITKDMNISDVVERFPSTVSVMLAYGLHCFDCGANVVETIEEGTLGHGWTADDLELLLKDLNEEAEKQEAIDKEKNEKK